MKKIFVAAVAALAVAGMVTSCTETKKEAAKLEDKTETYTGVLPAADADGIRYTLDLKYDKDDNYTEGDYKLCEETVLPDSLAKNDSIRRANTTRTEGDFTVEKSQGKTYLKLVPDSEYKDATDLYFLVDNDSSITLTNAQLETSATGLNYTLRRK